LPVSPAHIDPDIVQRLWAKYFQPSARELVLEKGEFLLRQNQQNKRLFLVLTGEVAGFLESESGNRHEMFRSAQKMFVGVHSFFSESFSAYADVIALQRSTLSYIEYDSFTQSEQHTLIEDFAPVIVHELSARQRFTQNMMLAKESALKKLYLTEKYASLGQMAAGLAHELNNAIGVINGNSEWIANEVYEYFRNTEIETIFSYFDRGFKTGQTLSSQEVRQKTRQMTERHKMPAGAARKLAQIDFDAHKLSQFSGVMDLDEITDRMHHFWEMGVAIHDILLASKHAVHVLQSIKQLSVSDQERSLLNINTTLTEALTLLRNATRVVNVDFRPGDLPELHANHGELVQMWVNIIKNACESMSGAQTENPTLFIETGRKRNAVWVKIANNGPCIPKEFLQQVFQPNFTTKKDGLSFGLGLGLAIVQRLVDSYNGRIEVKSVPGNTAFEIRIPINLT